MKVGVLVIPHLKLPRELLDSFGVEGLFDRLKQLFLQSCGFFNQPLVLFVKSFSDVSTSSLYQVDVESRGKSVHHF